MDHDIVWDEIGMRIRCLRNEVKLTQEQFGVLIGKSAQYVGRIERGQKISVDLVAIICQKMNVSADYVLFGILEHDENIEFVKDFSAEQIEICFDIIKKVSNLIRTPKGNKLLLRELAYRQYTLNMA